VRWDCARNSQAKSREFWTPEYWRGYCESRNPYRQYKLERDTALAIELLGPTDCERILEVGCGYGRISSSLVGAAQIKLVGVDGSESMLQEWRQTLTGDATGCRADAGQLPFKEESFDGVLCTGVLMHLQDQRLALAELCRVLRPGGRLVVSGNNLLSPLAIPVMMRMLLKPRVRQVYKLPWFYLTHLSKLGVEVRRMVGDTVLAVGLTIPGIGLSLLPRMIYPVLSALDRWVDRAPLCYLAHEIWFLGVKKPCQ
jgi:SAM-dependent methyltransferase